MHLRGWVHRAASSAKHKTAECFKSFSHVQGLSESHLALETGESSQNDRTEVASSTANHGRKFDYANFVEEATFTDETSDDEGYVTANDEWKESEDRNYENQSDGVADEDRRLVNAMHEASSTNGLHSLQPESGKNQNGEEGLSASQLQAINELRIRVLDLESDERLKKVDDATLLRFLVARNMDIAKSSDMFIKDWRWRNEFAPLVNESGISHQLKAEKAFLQGIDRNGRPLMIILGSKHFAKGRDMEEFKRYCFYCIEKVIACIPEGKDKFVTIFDLGGTAYRNMDTSATIMMVDLLQAHYPERMGRLFAIHVSAMITMPYKLVEPAIDMKTRQKITFVNDEDLESLLNDEIGEECVPKEYGGKAEFIPIQYAQIDRRRSFPITAVRSQ